MKAATRRAFYMLVVLTIVVINFLAVPVPVSAAAVITVNTTLDDDGKDLNHCSLREAVISANENIAFGGCPAGSAGTDQIYLPASAQKYVLTIPNIVPNENLSRTGDLDITSSMTITGAGPEQSVIYAAKIDRAFQIWRTGPVTIGNLSITGGYNIADGGGIYVFESTANFNHLKIFDNAPSSGGGGMYVSSKSVVKMDQSEISDNNAASAGAIVNEGTLTLTNSLVYNNKGTSLTTAGAIIANSLLMSEYTRIINTTIAKNSAPSSGVAGVTVSGTGTLELINDTIIDNTGIGLEVKPGGKGFTLNTINARQDVGIANCEVSPGAAFVSQGNNLISDASCGFTVASDILVDRSALLIDPALGFNGGPTQTYAMSPDSPAVDNGSDTGCPNTDQRVRGRPALGNLARGSHCDIGSFELNGSFFGLYLTIVRR